MKIFNSHSTFIGTDIASLSWEVEAVTRAPYGEAEINAVKDVKEVIVRLFISYNGQRINLHSHYTDKLLIHFNDKMRLLGQHIQMYLDVSGTEKCGRRIWLNHGESEDFMLGSASYHIDPKDPYYCLTIADCQRRIFFYEREPKIMAFLKELVVATTSIISAVEFTVARWLPVDDQIQA